MDNSEQEEIQLILGCINNDRKSQELLYKKYFRKMYHMCTRYTNEPDIICAIINDAFLNVFKNIQKYENRGVFENWIRKITFNTLADYFRKENKQIKFILIDHIQEPSNTQFNLSDTWDYDDLIAKIDLLTGFFRIVFIKYAIEGYSHKEIGEKLQISEGTSKWYLSEARKKLQQIFNVQNSMVKYGR